MEVFVHANKITHTKKTYSNIRMQSPENGKFTHLDAPNSALNPRLTYRLFLEPFRAPMAPPASRRAAMVVFTW